MVPTGDSHDATGCTEQAPALTGRPLEQRLICREPQRWNTWLLLQPGFAIALDLAGSTLLESVASKVPLRSWPSGDSARDSLVREVQASLRKWR